MKQIFYFLMALLLSPYAWSNNISCAVNANLPGEEISQKLWNKHVITDRTSDIKRMESFMSSYDDKVPFKMLSAPLLTTLSGRMARPSNDNTPLIFDHPLSDKIIYRVEIRPKLEYGSNEMWRLRLLKHNKHIGNRDRLRLLIFLKRVTTTTNVIKEEIISVIEKDSDYVYTPKMLQDLSTSPQFRATEVLFNKDLFSIIFRNQHLKKYWLQNNRSPQKTANEALRLNLLSKALPVSFNIYCQVSGTQQDTAGVYSAQTLQCLKKKKGVYKVTLGEINWRNEIPEICKNYDPETGQEKAPKEGEVIPPPLDESEIKTCQEWHDSNKEAIDWYDEKIKY